MNKWLAIALLTGASCANAAVHKCRTPEGRIIYTDNGCAQGQEVARDRDQAGNEGSRPEAPNAPAGHRENFYREQVKSTEQSAPNSAPTPEQH